MMNDFDFIKDKVENSGVKAPKNMDESYVADKLAGVQPKVIPFTKKRSVGKIIALAASFVLVAGVAVGVGIAMNNRSAVQPAVSSDTGLIRFENYDQVREAVKKIEDSSGSGDLKYTIDEEYNVAERSDGALGAASGSAEVKDSNSNTAGASSQTHSDTYKQVEGVDEADIIKTDGKYIYVVEQSYNEWDYSGEYSICIFLAEPGSSEPIIRFAPGTGTRATRDEATPDEEYAEQEDWTGINEIYIKDNKLIVICEHREFKICAEGDVLTLDYYNYNANDYTVAYVYDITDVEHPVVLDSFIQSGSYVSSRMIGDVLYLISNDNDDEDIPLCGRGAEKSEIPADCIYSIERPTKNSFLIVSAYNTEDYSKVTDTKAILGVGSEVYCNEDNMYITSTEWGDKWFWSRFGSGKADREYDDEEEFNVRTRIYKVSLKDGVSFTAYGEVEGYVNNQWSFDEWEGCLRVATTTQDEDYNDVNNLYVLNGELDIIGSVTGFAPTESIKAVRYMGDTAYVITYEQTDPLFVIDLRDPSDPKILGEVKISGFSTMLVPVDENTVLGLGINTGEYDYTDLEVQDGFKIALFDVSDKSDPKVLDSKSYVDYSSDVMYNPKALVYNPERGDYAVPLNYYRYDDSEDELFATDDDEYGDSWSEWYKAHTKEYGAVLNFRVEDGKIVEIDLSRTEHDRIDRCVYVGDNIYMMYLDEYSRVHLDSVSYK